MPKPEKGKLNIRFDLGVCGVDLRRHYINASKLDQIAPGHAKPSSRQRRRRPKRLTDCEIDTIIERYEAGSTQVELADEYGVNRKTVMKLLKDHNVVARRKVVELSVDQLAEVRLRRTLGASLQSLAAELRVHPQTLRRHLG